MININLMKISDNILTPEDFGLKSNSANELLLNRFKLSDLAEEYGTPLYVLDIERLTDRAKHFRQCVSSNLLFTSRVFYPIKCNSVPAVLSTVKNAGLSAEAMTGFELELAIHCGFEPSQIIVNGPCKTESFLRKCLKYKVHLIVIDSISELKDLIRIQKEIPVQMDVLLRVNPDFVPKDLNKNSATGSRQSSFGMNEEEILHALSILKSHPNLSFQGIHFHVGTGIRNPETYSEVIRKLHRLFGQIHNAGVEIRIVDVGGGFASMTTRELSSFEMIASQAISTYQLKFKQQRISTCEEYLQEIFAAMSEFFGTDIPMIYFEPGRCLVSQAQILLLSVHRIKERNGMKWLITDGGLGTITMPTYYEYHEMFLCNEFNRVPKEVVTITGPCCFASDLIYKNKLLPRVNEGEVLALMDTGAYFNSLESSFNFYKPAIVAVNGDDCNIVRRRENFSDVIQRDESSMSAHKEKYHEICNSQE
jgi:diaminopimelate decarboxylase